MIKYLKKLYLNMGKGINRYLVTILFLFVLTFINLLSIENSYNTSTNTWITSLIIGVFLSITLQMIYERFFREPFIRFIFYGISVVGVIVSYFILINIENNTILTVRIGLILFILFIGFLWIPTIKSKVSLPESLFSTFKAGLLAGVYAVTIFIGVCAILAAISGLITELDMDAFLHAANIIFVLFMPISFLSFIPLYSMWEQEDDHEAPKLSNRFFDTLIAYILIPVTIAFTGVLIIYIVTNITSDFWTENLLEAILVSYAIIVIVIYLLSYCVDKAIAKHFRSIFPYVLVVMVLIQTIASILKAMDIGITLGRYYAIMFGIFAFLAGIIFILKKYLKIEWIAPILIILAVISIVPPMDAFHLSISSQLNRLQTVLEKNNMLKDNQIVKKANISDEDKEIIVSSYRELNTMDAFDDIPWLEEYDGFYVFEDIFGFSEYNWENKEYVQHIYSVDDTSLLSIEGYDFMYHGRLFGNLTKELIQDGKKYILESVSTDGGFYEIRLIDEEGNVIISMDLKEIYDRMRTFPTDISSITQEDATFVINNEDIQMKIVLSDFYLGVQINEEVTEDNTEFDQYRDMSMEGNVLIDFK